MKYIKTLILNHFLDSDSLKGVEIGKIELSYFYQNKELLGVFYVVLKNENHINNSKELIDSIFLRAETELLRLILDKKPIDPYLEEIISNSIEKSIKYIKIINEYKVKTEFKIDEKNIIEKDNSKLAFDYVEYFIKKRSPNIEHIILKDIQNAIKYCSSYIKEPWKELEKKIEESNDRVHYNKYAILVLQKYYKKNFPGQNIRSLIQKNYPFYEEKLINGFYKKEEVAPIYSYAFEIIGGRWLEFEKMVEDKINSGGNFEEDECYDFLYYMLKIYPGRWRIAEPYFIIFKKGYQDITNLRNIQDYIEQKVIPEYKKNIKTFEDLQNYKDDFNMWDRLLKGKEIIFIVNPVYTLIKLRDLVYHYDKKIIQNLFKEYFPLNYKENIESII